ncbi:hypothetical protein F2P81_023764 [Scophthalmus maximus]|uniref:Uncharacterized protein n=1 Tax=Scophthalmus maximus TaxID=52904 RepID=A0A6A4RXE2_SCOMX|nr:hypothetical protein F2P81_023764 [Scophthalmus maximus]
MSKIERRKRLLLSPEVDFDDFVMPFGQNLHPEDDAAGAQGNHRLDRNAAHHIYHSHCFLSLRSPRRKVTMPHPVHGSRKAGKNAKRKTIKQSFHIRSRSRLHPSISFTIRDNGIGKAEQNRVELASNDTNSPQSNSVLL